MSTKNTKQPSTVEAVDTSAEFDLSTATAPATPENLARSRNRGYTFDPGQELLVGAHTTGDRYFETSTINVGITADDQRWWSEKVARADTDSVRLMAEKVCEQAHQSLGIASELVRRDAFKEVGISAVQPSIHDGSIELMSEVLVAPFIEARTGKIDTNRNETLARVLKRADSSVLAA